ncbi:hypothetical protein H4R99_001789 [Coemansia sp. RSA 1722]|nr:hypothetical protein GGF39_002034 [Coemansia sp. RSA 1721]KAJ2604472.1 hypothetical protein H4R99_001789 [Coemansia sp. RSA 1722]KAJ2637955.1 hypothetical protein GGF40_002005 [Coemansia sp. RSA 1286]
MAQMARPCIFAHIEDNLVQVIDLEPSMEDDIGVLRTYVHQQMNWTHSILVIIDLFEYEHNLGFYSPRIVRCFMQPEHVMEFYTEAKEYGVRFVETAGLEPLQREVPPKLPPRRKESLRKSSDSLDSLNTVFEADLISL